MFRCSRATACSVLIGTKVKPLADHLETGSISVPHRSHEKAAHAKLFFLPPGRDGGSQSHVPASQSCQAGIRKHLIFFILHGSTTKVFTTVPFRFSMRTAYTPLGHPERSSCSDIFRTAIVSLCTVLPCISVTVRRTSPSSGA